MIDQGSSLDLHFELLQLQNLTRLELFHLWDHAGCSEGLAKMLLQSPQLVHLGLGFSEEAMSSGEGSELSFDGGEVAYVDLLFYVCLEYKEQTDHRLALKSLNVGHMLQCPTAEYWEGVIDMVVLGEITIFNLYVDFLAGDRSIG